MPTKSTSERARAGAERLSGQRALLRFLQRQGRVFVADLARFEEIAVNDGLSIQQVLERQGVITEKELAVLLAKTLRLRIIDLTSFPLDSQTVRALRENVATRYEVIPVRVDDKTIEVATANPLDIEALKAVEFATGKRVQAVVATRLELRDALAHAYRLQESLEEFLEHVPVDETLTLTLEADDTDLRSVKSDAELPPVIKLADLILVEGIKSGASDVHVEPATDGVAVRYRIDGVLQESFRFPKWVQSALVARLKVMAKLDITERRVPQDGRIQIRHQGRLVDLRVSSLPAQFGEKMTLRILDATQAMTSLQRLGFNATTLQHLRAAGKHPEGLILVTGPTGSGKTTTLYALLREIMSGKVNIVTIENPIEYQLKGVNQVEVNEKQGLTFAGVLRSVLRQDPDVILVGEIRDRETAQIAMQAAQTGHLVLSTLHTNDASAAVTRLLDLGIESYALAAALKLVMAQRLVRRVCQECSAPYEPGDENRRILRLRRGDAALRRGAGCEACRQSGFSGRVGVYEVIPISQPLAKALEAGGSESEIRQLARAEGYHALIDDALEKLEAGVTTAEEVLRVVHVQASDGARCTQCQQDVTADDAVCPHCNTVLRHTCAACEKPLDPSWVSCPFCGAEAAPPAGATLPSAAAASVPAEADSKVQPPAQRRTFKVLVVDDDEDMREMVRMTIERSDLGLSVVTASDGLEALTVAEGERPDAVVLDVLMPEMDGFEVCRRLRSDVRTTFVPILMLTGRSGEDFVTEGFSAGADDYITKPFRREQLVARLRRMLERTYGKDAVRADGSKTTGAAPGRGLEASPSEATGGRGAPSLAKAARPSGDDSGSSASPTDIERFEQQFLAFRSLLAQFHDDREALVASVRHIEERLETLAARVEDEIAAQAAR